MKTFTENPYPYKHWLASLVMGSLIGIGSSLDMFVGYLMMSLVFSLPTFTVYLIAFGMLSKAGFSAFILKVILNLIAIAGVFITTLIIIGGYSAEITAIIYSCALVISSFFFRIEQPKANTQNNSEE